MIGLDCVQLKLLDEHRRERLGLEQAIERLDRHHHHLQRHGHHHLHLDVVLHQSDRKQMVPFTFTDEERQYLSDHRRGKRGGGVLFFSCPQISL